MKTSIYVDGFNFYYGCYKHQQDKCSPRDKWLDWRSFGEILVGADSVLHEIHYFTAHIGRDSRDPDQNLRQERFLKALQATPTVHIHYGKYKPKKVLGPLSTPKAKQIGWLEDVFVRVNTFEEKGSDVNLAVRLLDDAWSQKVDRAIVVSNDTDLIDAIRLARRHIRVDVASPQPKLAKELKKAAQFAWCLDPILLRDCRMSIPKIALDGSEVFPPLAWQQDAWPKRDNYDLKIQQAITALRTFWRGDAEGQG